MYGVSEQSNVREFGGAGTGACGSGSEAILVLRSATRLVFRSSQHSLSSISLVWR